MQPIAYPPCNAVPEPHAAGCNQKKDQGNKDEEKEDSLKKDRFAAVFPASLFTSTLADAREMAKKQPPPAQDQPDKQPPGDRQPGHPNLKRGGWDKGQSGNPGGRPKGKSLLHEIREVLDDTAIGGKPNPLGKTNRRILAERAIKHAMDGRSAYFREILERLFGKVPVRLEQRVETHDDAIDIPPHVVEAGLAAMLAAAGEDGGPKE